MQVRFGQLEQAVMDVVWAAPDAVTVRRVLEQFLSADRRVAYTTVQTVMDRLARKSILVRRPDGKANVYIPALSREDHSAAAMQEALDDAEDARAALLHFVERMGPEQEQALRAALTRRSPQRPGR